MLLQGSSCSSARSVKKKTRQQQPIVAMLDCTGQRSGNRVGCEKLCSVRFRSNQRQKVKEGVSSRRVEWSELQQLAGLSFLGVYAVQISFR